MLLLSTAFHAALIKSDRIKFYQFGIFHGPLGGAQLNRLQCSISAVVTLCPKAKKAVQLKSLKKTALTSFDVHPRDHPLDKRKSGQKKI
jgi:hypothetical protein